MCLARMMTSRPFLVVCLITCLNAHYDIDDTLLYKIDFKPFSEQSSLESPDTDTAQNQDQSIEIDTSENLSSGDKEEHSLTDSVIITSVDKEKFRCQIPKVASDFLCFFYINTLVPQCKFY